MMNGDGQIVLHLIISEKKNISWTQTCKKIALFPLTIVNFLFLALLSVSENEYLVKYDNTRNHILEFAVC